MASTRSLLVYGGSGFLGVHVVREALSAGFEVTVAGRTPPTVGVDAGAITFRPCDALVEGDAKRALAESSPTHVVICAALSTIAECDRYPKLAHVLNVEFPSLVAASARDTGAHVLYVSTDLVFGGRRPLGARFTELDPPAPMSEYGRTKCAGEAAVRAADDQSLCVRLPLLFGDSFGRGLGASDALIQAVLRGEQPALFEDEWRTPLDVRLAAKGIVVLANQRSSGLRHLAGPDRLSRVELGERVLAAAGFAPADARSSIQRTTRRAAGHAARPADVSLASVHGSSNP